jgi:competence ComEA-like helix-hairpin-helix protein
MYWFPDMPLNDLSFFSSPVETLTSALNPLIKMPLEIGPMQRKFFTGAPFTEELQEMPKHYGWLGITQALEAMGQVTKDKDGRPMADQRLIYALEQGWPMFARLQRWFPTDEAGKARAANTYLSNFLGVSVRTNDERSKANQIRRVISQLDEELTKQRGLGSDVRIAGYREISDTTRTVELNMDRLRYETDYLLTAINTFDADQLEEIPGVGETVARWIVLSRQQNGEYTSLEDLMGLEQLSENKVNEILLSLADKPESMGLPAAKAIDINSGTADELEKIDGIGPTTAAKIIDFRTRFGPITSVWQLAEIDGVTRRQVEQIRAYYLDDEARRASEEYQRYLRMGGGRPIEEVVTP